MKLRTALLLAVGTTPFFVFGANFTRTLSVGIHGEDVRELQKFLNTDPETRVASTGDGSPGSETDYFGVATKRALIKFQEKYRGEILAPIGMSAGTGVFGAKTREKLKNIIEDAKAKTGTPKETPKISVEKGEVIVMFPSQYSGKPGTMITLSGAGFTATGNTIYFGNDHAVVKAVSWNGKDITFKIPNIPKGIYSLYVKNARGDSNKDTFFVVTDGVTPVPRIDSVTPEHAKRGETVTIKGAGFTVYGNMVRSSISVAENIDSADGVSLSYTVPKTIFNTTSSPTTGRFSLPVWVYVVNENGVSEGKKFFIDL